jgi:hypothetical protein
VKNRFHNPLLSHVNLYCYIVVPPAARGAEDPVGAVLFEVLPLAGAEMATGADVRGASAEELASDAWLVLATEKSAAAEVQRLAKRGVPVQGHEAALAGIVKHRLDRQAYRVK